MKRTGMLRLLLALGVMGALTFVSHFLAGLAWEVIVNQALPLVVLGAWVVLRLVRREPWPDTPLNLPLTAWLAITCLSAALAIDPRISLDAWVRSLLWPVLNFWLVLDLLRHGWARALWGSLYLVAAVVGLLTVLEFSAWYLGGPLPDGSGLSWWTIGGVASPIPPAIHRARWGLLGAPAAPYLAAYWALLVPPLLGSAWDERRWAWRIVLLGAAALGTAVLLLTFSRSGLIGLAVAVPTTIALRVAGESRPRQWLWRHRRLLVVGLLGLAGLAVVLFGTFSALYFGGGHASGDEVRLALWQRAVELFLDRPLLGIGLHNFAQVGWIGLPPILRRVGSGVHNQALGVLAEHGALGALAGLWVLVAGVRQALLCWQAESRRSGLLAGTLGGLGGLMAASLTADLSWWPLRVPGILLVAWAVGGLSPFPRPKDRHWPWWLVLGLLAVSAVTLAWFDRATADFERARELARQGAWAEAASWTEQALAGDPQMRIYQLQAAEFWARAGLESEDRAALTHAAQLYEPVMTTPVHPLHRENWAWVLWALGDETAALAAAEQAASDSTEDAPVGAAIWIGAGALYESAGEEAAAREAYAHAVALSPGLGESRFWMTSAFRQTSRPTIWKRAVEIWSTEPQPWIAVQIVGVLDAAKTLDELARSWSAADPGSPLALESKALAMLTRGDTGATEAIHALCRIAPESPGCFLTRGWAALTQGDDQAGLRDLQTAIFVAPGTAYEPAAAWLLASWHWSHGQHEGAVSWVKRLTPQPPPFDTRDSQVMGRRALVNPLPGWPALRALPAGVTAWQQAERWLRGRGLEHEWEALCRTAKAYDPFFDPCRSAGPTLR